MKTKLEGGNIEPKLTKPETAKYHKATAYIDDLIGLDSLQQLQAISPLRPAIKDAVSAVVSAAGQTKDAVAALVGLIGCDAPDFLPMFDSQAK